jgi:CheY-like chemotaxis protein
VPKVLLVEDNEESREGLSRYLRRNGYEILFAVDGRQAVDVARASVPDLILIDLSLPVLDGWEATRQLKAGSVTREIPVIALTAHAMAGDRERALEAGCDDYDTKPIDFPRLLTRIESLLEKKAQPAPQPEERRHLRRL